MPTLYFAEGLPFYAVNFMALLFYQRMGVSNAVTTVVVSLLALALDAEAPLEPAPGDVQDEEVLRRPDPARGRRGPRPARALPCRCPGYFAWSIAILAVVAFASSTHDIAADGLYIASLSPKEQAAYAGWSGAFYNVGADLLDGRAHLAGRRPPAAVRRRRRRSRRWCAHGWRSSPGSGRSSSLLGLYHSRVLPTGGEERSTQSLAQMAATFRDVVVDVLPEAAHPPAPRSSSSCTGPGEGQVIKIGPLFLQADRATGGLGLTLQQFGTIYGTFGSAAFILGSVLGGYFVSWLGLKRALLPLVLILNVPMLAYWYLSVALPTDARADHDRAERRDVRLRLRLRGRDPAHDAGDRPGAYQTAHYAIGNSLMNLGVILPGAVSGWIQAQLGYRGFFVWVLVSAIPAVLLARFVPIRGGARTPPGETAAA